MAYKAQILSPFTTMYSRRTFNEFFQEQLGTRLTPYAWEFAQWHAHVWGVAQPALQMEPTKKWRLKGGSDLGTLPNLMIICAIEHIVSHLMHTAHGVHRIRQDDGTFLEFPATVRDRLPAELWKDHKKNCPPSHLLGRTHYLELVQLCSNQDQKSLGALDGVAEFCGRVQEAGGGGGDDGARRRAAAPSVAGTDAFEGEGCNGGGGSGGGGGDGGGGGGDGGGDGARRRAAAPSADASVAEARVTFEELRIALLRALARVKHYHSHERRAAHEAKVLERLMKELDDTGCIAVADWKMKFLASSFREEMSKFFGKSGELPPILPQPHGEPARLFSSEAAACRRHAMARDDVHSTGSSERRRGLEGG